VTADVLWVLLVCVGTSLIVVALLARYELLAYAAGWDTESVGLPAAMPVGAAVGPGDAPRAYLVYLDGIGKLRVRDTRDGARVVAGLVDAAPDVRVIGGVLPYSPLGHELGSRRPAPWLRHRAAVTLFLFNAVQVFMAADRRYRPYYNRAVGEHIAAQLTAAGDDTDSGVPVILFGYSGGAQVGVGAAAHLTRVLAGPVTMVMMGGFHNGRNELGDLAAVHSLDSDRDAIARLGRWIFPARWPVTVRSPWNRARRAGQVIVHRQEPATHLGPDSYISPDAHLADGRSHLHRTCEIVAELIDEVTTTERRVADEN
jgi:hypothetical protein